MKLNISEIRKIIVEELQVLSEAASPNQENTVTDFDRNFDYAYFQGAWWARGKNDSQQTKLEDTRWFGNADQIPGETVEDFVWAKVPARAQEVLSAAHPEIVSSPEPAAPAAPEPAAPAESAPTLNITTRVDDILKTMDVDVYGSVINVLDQASRGDFGPEIAARAESLFSLTQTLSPLAEPFTSPGYDSSEMSGGAPLRSKIQSLVKLKKIPVGSDMGHGGLILNLLARSAGIPLAGLPSIEVAIIGSLTGNADKFMRQFDRAVTALEVVKGETKGASASNPKRYVKNAFKDLDLLTQGTRVRDEEDAQAVRDRAAALIRAVERGAEFARYGIDALRRKLQNDAEARSILSGIIPANEEALRQFV